MAVREFRVIHGDVLDGLRLLPDGSVRCCITSPPYWGLRDYGHAGQLGLEKTPEEYVSKMVDVFREVRRVLADDGTCWLNLGDSYAGSGKGGNPEGSPWAGFVGNKSRETAAKASAPIIPCGLKPKDLVGIPWMVARALQAPYYTGKIRNESDRAWLAGWMDGEGTISFVERNRGEGHTPTHDARIYVTNTDRGPLDHFSLVSGGHVYVHDDGTRENRYGSRECYRWQMGTHDGALLLRELYPYLRTKRRQAALVWTLYMTLRHKNGHARTPESVVARRQEIAGMIRSLNAGGEVSLPPWVEEPPSPTEPGWWLRQDIIWSKLNPMPESVTDRCTKAHEYVFLLSKSARYFYDARAIAEIAEGGDPGNTRPTKSGRRYAAEEAETFRTSANLHKIRAVDTRNRRSVWHIATQPFPEAHFAVMPESLVEPCVLAGSAEGDTVLDPFAGSGTVGVVALRAGRKFVGIELNPEYVEMAKRRITNDAPLLNQEAV